MATEEDVLNLCSELSTEEHAVVIVPENWKEEREKAD